MEFHISYDNRIQLFAAWSSSALVEYRNMSDTDRDSEFEAKLASQLAAGKPYEAFQFAESYLARKYSANRALQVLHRLLQAIAVFMAHRAAAQGAHLLVWYLSHLSYVAALDRRGRSTLLGTVSDLIEKGDAGLSGEFADLSASSLVQLIVAEAKKGEAEGVDAKVSSRALLALGDALGRIYKWEKAVDLFLKEADMQRVAVALHHWAEGGPVLEYPLYFSRVLLTLLCGRRLADAATFVQCSNEFLEKYEENKKSELSIDGSNIAVWHFSVIVSELVGLGSSVSIKEKVDIYAMLIKKYHPALKSGDPELVLLADKICTGYKLNQQAAVAKGGTGNSFGAMFKKNLAGKF